VFFCSEAGDMSQLSLGSDKDNVVDRVLTNMSHSTQSSSTTKTSQTIQELLKQGLVSAFSNNFNNDKMFTNLKNLVFLFREKTQERKFKRTERVCTFNSTFVISFTHESFINREINCKMRSVSMTISCFLRRTMWRPSRTKEFV
jgi:hypothetical protein